jgi:cytochrome c2
VNRPAFRATVFSTLALLASFAPALAAPEESEDGKVAFNNACRTCHSFKPDDNRLGPTLHGIVGRVATRCSRSAASPTPASARRSSTT